MLGGCANGNYTGWHTYGADWEPDLILNNAVGVYGGAILAPAAMKADYVKAWQP